MVRKVDTEEKKGHDLKTWQQDSHVSLEHANVEQRMQLLEAFGKFSSLFQPRPGLTEVMEHQIHLKDATLIRQRPYRVPECLVLGLKGEIQTMRELGIIHQ